MLREALRARTDDPRSQVMLALALHAKYVISGPILLRGRDTRRRDETEIESLVLSALPHMMGHELHVLAAAKPLWFVNARHRRLVLNLAEEAFRTTTGLATAYATLGQLTMWSGGVDEGLGLIDRGLELMAPGSEGRRCFLSLRCHGLLAAGAQDAFEASAALLHGGPVGAAAPGRGRPGGAAALAARVHH